MFDLQLDHNFSSHLELDKIFVASTITNIELGPGPSKTAAKHLQQRDECHATILQKYLIFCILSLNKTEMITIS